MCRRLALVVLTAVLATVLAVGTAGAGPYVPSETPDDTWMTNGTVFTSALSEDGKTLYIGGKFNRVLQNPPGQSGPKITVSGLAAIDVQTGNAIGSWTPTVTGGKAVVRSLEVKGNKVYVGGNFTAVAQTPSAAQQPRQNLAAVSATNGAVDPDFVPQVTKTNGDPYVHALLAGDSKLYVGGFFNSAGGGKVRANLAAFDLTTGALDGTWKPKVSNQVKDLEFASDRLSIFAAGAFKTATSASGGTAQSRESVARFHTDNGNLHDWQVPPGVIGAPQQGWDLTVTEDLLYGGFGAGPNFAAAFHLDEGNVGRMEWRWDTVGNVQTVALSQDESRLFLGGHFGTYVLDQKVCGNRDLSGLVSVNAATGSVMCDWVPELAPTAQNNPNGGWDINITDSKVWVGGGFTHVNGIDQRNLARFAYEPTNFPPRVDLDGYKSGGIDAAYYDNIDFTGASVSRIDPTIDFNFGDGSPDPSIDRDTFSARYTGQIEAPVSGQYTFTTRSDDGVRLTVNGETVVDNYTDHAPTDNSGVITLQAGERYDIQLEFYENGGGAEIRLYWQYPGLTQRQIVPSNRLLNSGSPNFAATFVAGLGPQPIVDQNNLSVTDTDDANLRSATVTLANRPDGNAESLSADTSGTTIVANYNAQTGVLTLTGPASTDDFESVLRTVRYNNTALNPSGSNRSVTFVADDGTVNSNTATSTVTVVAAP
jgi:hypothetical protein